MPAQAATRSSRAKEGQSKNRFTAMLYAMVSSFFIAPPAHVPSSRREQLALRRASVQKAEFAADETAAFDVGIGKSLGLVFVIVGAIIAAVIVAQLAPSYITAVADTSTAITNTSFGDPTADALRSPMALVVSIGGLVGIVLLVVGVIAVNKGK